VISLVVAAAENDVIGAGGRLPWHLSDDLRRFKALTLGKPVVMGRKTWESIGKPLPGRRNIVITRRRDYAAGDADEVMIIGGSLVYAAFLPRAGRVYLTRVHAEISGDAFFPALDPGEWGIVAEEKHPADDRHELSFTFLTLERRPPGSTA
jgi:dihydrofolate reductase